MDELKQALSETIWDHCPGDWTMDQVRMVVGDMQAVLDKHLGKVSSVKADTGNEATVECPIVAGEGYVLLEAGAIIQDGDEWWDDFAKKWKPTKNAGSRVGGIGSPHAYRRKVKPTIDAHGNELKVGDTVRCVVPDGAFFNFGSERKVLEAKDGTVRIGQVWWASSIFAKVENGWFVWPGADSWPKWLHDRDGQPAWFRQRCGQVLGPRTKASGTAAYHCPHNSAFHVVAFRVDEP